MERSREERSREAEAMAATAALAAAIERWVGDLSLAEEPARFVTAVEDGAP